MVNAYRRRYYGGLLVAPAIAVLFVMNIFPLLWSLGLSFFAYQANQQSIRFVGLDNYVKVLTNDHCRAGHLGRAGEHGHVRGAHGLGADDRRLSAGHAVRQAVSAAAYLLILVLTPMMLSVVAVGVFFPYYYDPTFGILS